MAEAMSIELQAKVAVWRQKLAEGTATQDDMKEAVLALRGGRVSAQAASDTSRRKKAIVAVPNADDMLNELGS